MEIIIMICNIMRIKTINIYKMYLFIERYVVIYR